MLRTRIFLLMSAIALVVLIFSLPKVVVDNKTEELGSEENENRSISNQRSDDEVSPHDSELDADITNQINRLKKNLALAENNEKNIIFADSLAKLYLKSKKYDSAAKFFEIIANIEPSIGHLEQVGNAYYEAFGFAMDDDKRKFLGGKAQKYFDIILTEDKNNLSIKNKLAMTYLSTENPMKGIMMLREILEVDPDNEEALFNLGILSMQSGQYDKAVERLSNLVKLHPENTQAQFFLGISYLEIGEKEKAKEQFKLVKMLDNDPSVIATVDGYLEELNK